MYQRVRADIQAGDAQSYIALVDLFKQEDDMIGLVDLYREQAEHITEMSERESLLTLAAEVSLQQLQQPEEAIVLYQDILELNPQSESSLISLSRLYSDLGRFEEQLETLQVRTQVTEKNSDGAAFTLERALIYRDQLSDPISAIEVLQELLVDHPDTEGLIDAFESLLTSMEVRLDAAKALTPIYRDNEQWSQYVNVLSDTLEDRLDLGEKIDVLSRYR